jgi:SAM-dependent methyltransferase
VSYVVSGIFFLIMVGLMSLIWTSSRGAPWVPTHRDIVDRMLRMAGVKPGEVVYDLGCGDGRVLVVAARRYGARAVGVELDLFGVDLHSADVVFAYLLQDTNDRLKEKLRSELRPGARIVSNTFHFSGLPLARMDDDLKLYLYRIGE